MDKLTEREGYIYRKIEHSVSERGNMSGKIDYVDWIRVREKDE